MAQTRTPATGADLSGNGRRRQVPPATSPTTADPRSTTTVLGDIIDDLRTLVRQEVELAKIEITEALTARAQAAAAGLAGALFGLFVLVFGSTTLAVWLGDVLAERWMGWAVVTGGWLLLMMMALAFAVVRAKAVPMKPERTERSIEENVEWAKQHLNS